MIGAFMAIAFAAAHSPPADVTSALSPVGRPPAYVALDEVRRPFEVLSFLGLNQGDRVLDYDAGGGYYTEIIAKAVGPRGLVLCWIRPAFAARDRVQAAHARIRQRASNALFIAPPDTALSLPAASFDAALLHLVYHESYWESAEFGVSRVDPDRVTEAIFHTLRPGGVVVVVDHIGGSGRDPREEVEATHRIDPAVVRADFERAGFIFEAQSDLLRNPADDQTKRVFETSIRGRTDRFMFRFRKPPAS